MSQDNFNTWVDYTNEIYPYQIVNAITIVLMCARNLVELNLQFPSFGVLFSTLSRAKYDLLNFFIVSLPQDDRQ
ncbi:MAG: hypothetical protein P4M11_03270 [Candidatus Pacebacteria bacterium]|nr:hypothetical protein [Candidatus Paceibacterota bacterium]